MKHASSQQHSRIYLHPLTVIVVVISFIAVALYLQPGEQAPSYSNSVNIGTSTNMSRHEPIDKNWQTRTNNGAQNVHGGIADIMPSQSDTLHADATLADDENDRNSVESLTDQIATPAVTYVDSESGVEELSVYRQMNGEEPPPPPAMTPNEMALNMRPPSPE